MNNKILVEYLSKIQPTSKKSDKKDILNSNKLENYLLSTKLNDIDSDYVFEGDNGLNENSEIKGLIELSGIYNVLGKFKGSSKQIIKIIHNIITKGKHKKIYQEKLSIFDNLICSYMKLNIYYKIEEFKDIVLDILNCIRDVRSTLTLNELGFTNNLKLSIDLIESEMEIRKKEVVINKKKTLTKITKSNNEELDNNIEDDYDEDTEIEKRKAKLLEKLNNIEPRNWAEVDNLPATKKKLLTTDFLGTDIKIIQGENMLIVDEEESVRQDNKITFIDPLCKINVVSLENNNINKDYLLDYNKYEENGLINKLHIQSNEFDPLVYLDTFHRNSNYNQFVEKIKILEENISLIKPNDLNTADKNIYKYLECKKIIDNIMTKYSKSTSKVILNTKQELKQLDKDINNFIMPLKSSFEQIIIAKTSKELISKFKKFFDKKEKIETFLKFSNFEKLADFLKKSYNEMLSISQTKMFEKDFYNYFYETFDKVKLVLIKVIKESNTSEEIIKHFRYILEFEVDGNKIDELVNILKKKITDKIDNYLSSNVEETNIEIKKLKEYFAYDDSQANYQNEAFYKDINNETNLIDFDQIVNQAFQDGVAYYEETNNENNSTLIERNKKEFKIPYKRNKYAIEDSNITNEPNNSNKINANETFKLLHLQIKEFVFTMRIVEQNINLKIQNFINANSYNFNDILLELYSKLLNDIGKYLFRIYTNQTLYIYNNKDTNDESNKCLGHNEDLHVLNFIMKYVDKYKQILDCDNVNKVYNNLFLFEHFNNSYKLQENNITFKSYFNINSFSSINDSIIALFLLFEMYLINDSLNPENKTNLQNNTNKLNEDKNNLDKNNLSTLKDLMNSKKKLLKAIFISFLNNKLIAFVNNLEFEVSINYFEQHYTINNQTCFVYVKNYLEVLYTDFRDIILFYTSIFRKLSTEEALSLVIDPKIIFINFYLSSKLIMLKLLDFYNTELLLITNSYEKLNLLCMDMLKNINFLKSEVLILSRMLFKNKEDDYIEYYSDFQKMGNKLKELFMEDYIVYNTKCYLFGCIYSGILPIVKFENKDYDTKDKTLINYKSRIDKSRNYAMQINEVYDKYSEYIVENYMPLYVNYRANVVYLLLYICNVIKELIIVEVKSGSLGSISQIYDIIVSSLEEFLKMSIEFLISEKNRLIDKLNFNEINQIILEFEIIFRQFNILENNNISNNNVNNKESKYTDIIKSKLNSLFKKNEELLISISQEIVKKNENKEYLTENDIIKKNIIIDEFISKYKVYFDELKDVIKNLDANFIKKRQKIQSGKIATIAMKEAEKIVANNTTTTTTNTKIDNNIDQKQDNLNNKKTTISEKFNNNNKSIRSVKEKININNYVTNEEIKEDTSENEEENNKSNNNHNNNDNDDGDFL